MKSFLSVVVVLAAVVGLACLWTSTNVELVDYTRGHPPFRPVEARQVTGPSLIEAIKATGGTVAETLD